MASPAASSAVSRKMPVRTPLTVAETLCSYSRHACSRTRLDGYEYCIHHILEDKTSPYRQCCYVSAPTGCRCTNAALKTERRESYCADHARQLTRAQTAAGTARPVESTQSLFSELESRHGSTARLGASSSRSMETSTADGGASSCSEDEFGSQPTYDSLMSQDTADSEAESIDSEQDNALKHAGVYTAEEVALMFRDKLIRLQSLYIDQFKRLHHRLKENRRQYLRAMCSAIHSSTVTESDSQDDTETRTTRQKMRALSRYYKRFGKEALLLRQCKERRIAFSEGSAYKAPVYDTCVHASAGGEKCTERVLPLSQYCLQHILSDGRQVLYACCNYGNACSQPVAMVTDRPSCLLHRELPPIECRYSRRENETHVKEEHVDVVTVTETKTG